MSNNSIYDNVHVKYPTFHTFYHMLNIKMPFIVLRVNNSEYMCIVHALM